MKKENDIKIIDFHSHILPGADHGSDGIETSQKQLELMKKAGIDIAVATSHFYPQEDTVDAFLARRESAAKLLASKKPEDIKLALGAEVYCVAGLETLEGIEKLTIKGTNIMLLEMPMTYWNNNIISTVMKLGERFDIVLAHIDRYPTRDLEKVLDVTDVMVQVNASNILKGSNKKRLKEWLESDIIYAVGSDIHMADKKALKSFKKLRKYLKYDIDTIFSRTEELIKGAELI